MKTKHFSLLFAAIFLFCPLLLWSQSDVLFTNSKKIDVFFTQPVINYSLSHFHSQRSRCIFTFLVGSVQNTLVQAVTQLSELCDYCVGGCVKVFWVNNLLNLKDLVNLFSTNYRFTKFLKFSKSAFFTQPRVAMEMFPNSERVECVKFNSFRVGKYCSLHPLDQHLGLFVFNPFRIQLENKGNKTIIRELEKNNLPDDIVKIIIQIRQDRTQKSLRDLHR